MATFNIKKVPTAFKSQQPPFFFGGSQVPETLLSSGLSLHQPQAQKKRKIGHYFKKKPEVIDLVSSSDSDEDMPFYFDRYRRGKYLNKDEWIEERKKIIQSRNRLMRLM